MWLNALRKVSLRVLWKMVLFMRDFQNSDQYRTLRNVSIYFLLFYHNNIMLKTDIMLDFWLPYIEKRMHKICGEIFSGFCKKPVQISESV